MSYTQAIKWTRVYDISLVTGGNAGVPPAFPAVTSNALPPNVAAPVDALNNTDETTHVYGRSELHTLFAAQLGARPGALAAPVAHLPRLCGWAHGLGRNTVAECEVGSTRRGCRRLPASAPSARLPQLPSPAASGGK